MRAEEPSRARLRRPGRWRYEGALTLRQRDVFELLATGLTNEEIALQLGITEDGVKYHVSQILLRLGVENRHDAVALRLRTESKGRLAAWAPVMFLRKLPFAWLSKAAAGAALTAVAVGIILLAWGVMTTSTATVTTTGCRAEQSAGYAPNCAPSVVQAAAGEGAVTAISAGAGHSCAVKDGGVWCWGGQLGLNNDVAYSSVAVPMPGLASGVSAISGECALKDGGVWCWGVRLPLAADGTVVAVPMPGLASGVSAISGECALKGGGAWCWGFNTTNNALLFPLQVGMNVSPVPPEAVAGLASGVSAISAVADASCALKDGGVWCWGLRYSNPPGTPKETGSLVPVAVSGLASGVSAISAGSNHSCALKDGGAWCWGNGGFGQLGNDGTANSDVPVAVSGLANGVSAISAGGFHTCALKDSGVWCWGLYGNGRLGNNGTTDSHVPVAVSGLASGVSAISTGVNYTCALKDGGAWCWGYNGHGNLGNNSTTDSPVPVRVLFTPASAGDIAAAPDAKPLPSHASTDSADHRTAYVIAGTAAGALAIVVAGVWAVWRRRRARSFHDDLPLD